MNIPSVTVEQMRQVDKIAVEDFGLQILMMMENASIHIADLACQMLSEQPKNNKIVVMAHKGNNGGDGLGAARHLINRGAEVTILLSSSPYELSKDAAKQYRILQHCKCPIIEVTKEHFHEISPIINSSDLIIDGLLGYNIQGVPRNHINTLIKAANASHVPILSIDIPSGLDGNTGKSFYPTIKAKSTVTLALPKKGLFIPEAKQFVGDVWLADLSIPRELYQQLGIEVSLIFNKRGLIPLQISK